MTNMQYKSSILPSLSQLFNQVRSLTSLCPSLSKLRC